MASKKNVEKLRTETEDQNDSVFSFSFYGLSFNCENSKEMRRVLVILLLGVLCILFIVGLIIVFAGQKLLAFIPIAGGVSFLSSWARKLHFRKS